MIVHIQLLSGGEWGDKKMRPMPLIIEHNVIVVRPRLVVVAASGLENQRSHHFSRSVSQLSNCFACSSSHVTNKTLLLRCFFSPGTIASLHCGDGGEGMTLEFVDGMVVVILPSMLALTWLVRRAVFCNSELKQYYPSACDLDRTTIMRFRSHNER